MMLFFCGCFSTKLTTARQTTACFSIIKGRFLCEFQLSHIRLFFPPTAAISNFRKRCKSMNISLNFQISKKIIFFCNEWLFQPININFYYKYHFAPNTAIIDFPQATAKSCSILAPLDFSQFSNIEIASHSHS